ncbi:MAG: hypothetical protein AAFQ04_12745 [Pseudomonadota bacterium]
MLRRSLYWGVALLAFIAVGGYWLLFPPLPMPPEIARGLPTNFAEADEEFGRRVNAAFSLPLTVDELITRLGEQGFTINIENSLAVFEKQRFPCRLIWRIHWDEDDESVTALSPIYGGVCL